LYRTYQQLIVGCDLEIEKMLLTFESRADPVEKPLPPDRKRNRAGKKRRRKNGHPHPEFDLPTETYKLFGVDVTQIPGLEENALPLFSEVGRDMSKWPTAAHFVSWLALCPDNDISGGKLLWRGVRTVKNRAGQLFRLAAFSLHHSSTPLGNYLRRMKAKPGPQAATTATAHKVAVIFYTMVKNQVEYDESIWAPETPTGRSDWKSSSSGKPESWATNSFPSNTRLHNELAQGSAGGVPWKLRHASVSTPRSSNGQADLPHPALGEDSRNRRGHCM
jgi:Transposase IS116/IS110/IS902 family